jgi:hypothetical protein
MSEGELLEQILEEILEMLRVARVREWRPWELQDELKKISKSTTVVAVGDDLSFTLKTENELGIESRLNEIGGKITRIYPFKLAYRFDRGFIAIEKNFIRIGREIDEELLKRIFKISK